MLYKFTLASLHFFLASFMIVQLYTPVSIQFGENPYLMALIFVAVSVSVFYLSYKKADSRYYSFKTVLLITGGYWFVSTMLVLAKLPYLNIILIVGLYYYLIKKNPDQITDEEAPDLKATSDN